MMPKKIFTQELEGTRRRGRPRKGGREEVERDLRVLAVRRRRELVIERKKWRGIVRQAKAHSGLQRQRKKNILSPVAVLYTENFNFCSNTEHTVNPWSSDSQATDRPALPAHRGKKYSKLFVFIQLFVGAVNVAYRIAFTKRRYLGQPRPRDTGRTFK